MPFRRLATRTYDPTVDKPRPMRRIYRAFSNSEDGQALVELALVLPVLLLVLFAIVEMGHAVNTWNNSTDIANIVARAEAVGHKPSSGACSGNVSEFVKCEAKADGIPESEKVTVCVGAPASAKVGSPVEVKVYSEYKWLPYLAALGPASAITGRATLRIEQVTNESEFKEEACK
jgi:TadE-like protein